jgi:hypothetical protein
MSFDKWFLIEMLQILKYYTEKLVNEEESLVGAALYSR